MTDGHLRLATTDDIDRLAACHLACWQETYAHLLSPAFMAGLTVEGRRQVWEKALAMEDRRIWIAEADGDIVGFSCARPGDGPRDLELAGIYLRRAHHGTDLGQRLLDVAIGDQPAFLWVAEDNPRARAFYSRNGFRTDGARRVQEEWENVVIIRMVR